MKTYETPGHVVLNLEVPSGRVEIETADVHTTDVELEPLRDDERAREALREARIGVRERASGHEVFVAVHEARGFFVGFGRMPEFRLRIRCPYGADIDLRTRSADVRASGRYTNVSVRTAAGDTHVQEATRDVRIKSASGDVSVERVGGVLDVNTASGDVAVQQAGGAVNATLVSGDVWIRDAQSSVSVNTVSGDARLDAVVEGTIELRTVSGDAIVGVRRGSRIFVDMSTVSGSTSSELELSDSPASAPEESAPLVELFVKTVSGDAAIVRAPAPTPAPAG